MPWPICTIYVAPMLKSINPEAIFPLLTGTGNNKLLNRSFFPGEEWRGDVARIIMYMNLRYDENFDAVGGLSLFLKWNAEDPVSKLEIQHNLVIAEVQGNRNPFIDNPILATLIWGGKEAENRWNTSEKRIQEPKTPELFLSEYLEGSGHNKALKISNPCSHSQELSGYSLKKQTNGEGEWVDEYKFSEQLASKTVFMIINKQADLPELLKKADDQVNAPLNFNGNDPIALFKNEKLIERIGSSEGAYFAQDVTLTRKSNSSKPNSSFDPEDWLYLEENTTDGFGKY